MLADTGRFPAPDFSSGYEMPSAHYPAVGEWVSNRADGIALALALFLAAWLVLRVRSRRWIRILGLASLLWFGFARMGCLCPMGALQKVVASIAGVPGSGLTLAASFLFLAPLAAALLFGRVYCAAVCPHGALQDLLVVRAVRVPRSLDAILRIGRWLFFLAVVLFAATGSGWLLCRFDPYVVFFRRAGPPLAVAMGVLALTVGAFVVRPYCRYVCPYGLLLGLLSRLSWRSAVVTPQECVRCRLCERICPVDAIEPAEAPSQDLAVRAATRRRLAWLLTLILPAMGTGALLGSWAAPWLASAHPDLKRLEIVVRHGQGDVLAKASRAEYVVDAVEAEGLSPTDLEAAAESVRQEFRRLTPWAGAVLGLALLLRLVHLTRLRRSVSYDIDPGDCVGCSRCFAICPLNAPRVASGGS